MELTVSTEQYENDLATKTVWGWLRARLDQVAGHAYYRHPVIRTTGVQPPDLLVLALGLEPLALRCLPWRLQDVSDMQSGSWTVAGQTTDSPVLELEDYREALQHKFNQHRALRGRLAPAVAIALPNIDRTSFAARFPAIPTQGLVFSQADVELLLRSPTNPLSGDEWRLAESVFQSAIAMQPAPRLASAAANTKGEAIQVLEREIALLDREQEKAAIQIPPGPQRIRGLAGTGKTVLLAMKAANIHVRYPDKKILFTFNTQSLYAQARSLITRFFRTFADEDPNWENLHIRHGWGGRHRVGVYRDLCDSLGIPSMSLSAARGQNPSVPFAACCEQLLSSNLQPTYDYVLVDEAQDFPKQFFRVLWRITREPHPVYWAYDELQSLSSLEMPDLRELFGVDSEGVAVVALEGEYPGGIEKDLVLTKSYRCPRKVLTLAHAIGLGLYSPRGCVQMLRDENSWRAAGYEVRGRLAPGEAVELRRPQENSPNRIEDIYKGPQKIVRGAYFNTQQEELEWLAHSIRTDVFEDGVAPEHIVVVALDSMRYKNTLSQLQALLFPLGIQSIIPGLLHDVADFATPGAVTLCTVFRAKGNEAPVVYVMNCEQIAEYSREIEARNKAFTAVSRTKGWLTLTGSGRVAEVAFDEIKAAVADFPTFKFVYPKDVVKQLDLESSRRQRAVRVARRSVQDLLTVDPEALRELSPEEAKLLLERLKKTVNDAE